ncbi:MAG: hypothetical protein AAB434_11835 [Planctomycetota bacterium]
METVRVKTEIGTDGKIRLVIPSGMPPGPADVIVIIGRSENGGAPGKWAQCYGLGRDIWANEDAQEYVNRMRDEWGK